jgi:hypothetical protein
MIFKTVDDELIIAGNSVMDLGEKYEKLSTIASNSIDNINNKVTALTAKKTPEVFTYSDIDTSEYDIKALTDENYNLADKLRQERESNELLEKETAQKENISELEQDILESKKSQKAIDNATSESLKSLGYKKKSYYDEIKEEQTDLRKMYEAVDTTPINNLKSKENETKSWYQTQQEEAEAFRKRLETIETAPIDNISSNKIPEQTSEQLALNSATEGYTAAVQAENVASSENIAILKQEKAAQEALNSTQTEGTTRKKSKKTFTYSDIDNSSYEVKPLTNKNFDLAEQMHQEQEYNELLSQEATSIEAEIQLSKRRIQNYEDLSKSFDTLDYSQKQYAEGTNTVVSELEQDILESKNAQNAIDNVTSETLENLGYKQKGYLAEIREEQAEISKMYNAIDTAPLENLNFDEVIPVDNIKKEAEEVKSYYQTITEERLAFQERLKTIETAPIDNISSAALSEETAQKEENAAATVTQTSATEALIEAQNRELLNNVTLKFKTMELTEAQRAALKSEGEMSIAKLKIIAETNNEAGALARQTLALMGVTTQTKAATIATKALSVATKGLTIAANMIAMTAITEGISWFVENVIKAKEKAEEASQAIIDAGTESDYESLSSTVGDVKDRYAELAQGIQNLGRATQSQGTLSNDEYSEFLDLSNQLADCFPQLTKRYDDNGNAILDLTGNVNGIITSLDNLLEKEEELAGQEAFENMDEVWGKYSENAKKAEQTISDLNDRKEKTDYWLSKYKTEGLTFDDNLSLGDADALDLDVDFMNQIKDKTWNELSDAERTRINTYYDDLISDIENQKDKITTYNSDFANSLIDSLNGESIYKNLDSTEQGLVNSLLENINSDSVLSGLYDADSWDDAYGIIQEQILNKISALDKDPTLKAQYDEAWNNLLAIDTDASYSESLDQIQEYVDQMAKALNMDSDQLMLSLGYDVEGGKADIERAKERFTQYLADGTDTAAIDEYIDSLSKQEITLLLEADSDDIEETVRKLTKGMTDADKVIYEDWQDKKEELSKVMNTGDESAIRSASQEVTAAYYDCVEAAEKAGQSTQEWMDSYDTVGAVNAVDALTEAIRQTLIVSKSLDSITFDPSTAYEALTNALSDQSSNGYITTDNLTALQTAYGDLSGVIEYLPNGIRLNTEAMMEYTNQQAQAALVANEMKEAMAIEDFKDEKKALEKEIKSVTKDTKVTKKLTAAYNKGEDALKDYIDSTEDLTAEEKEKLTAHLDTIDDLITEINEYDELENQIRAATSALNDYTRATETANDSDNYNTAYSMIEDLQDLWEKGWTGTDDFKKGMDYLAGSGVFESEADYIDNYKAYMDKAEKYITEDISGIYAFIDDGVAKSKELGKEWITESNGQYTIAIDDLQEFADAMGMSIDWVTDMLLATNDAWDFDVDFSSLSDGLLSSMEDLNKQTVIAREDVDAFREEINKLADAGLDSDMVDELNDYCDTLESKINDGLDLTFGENLLQLDDDEIIAQAEKVADDVADHIAAKEINFNWGTEATDTLIRQTSEYMDTLEVGTDEWNDALTVLTALTVRKQELEEPLIFSADTSGLDQAGQGAILLLEQWQEAYNELELLELNPNADTSELEAAKETLSTIQEQINSIDSTTLAAININPTTDTQKMFDEIQNAKVLIESDDTELTVTANTDPLDEAVAESRSNIENTPATLTVIAELIKGFQNTIQDTIDKYNYQAVVDIVTNFVNGNTTTETTTETTKNGKSSSNKKVSDANGTAHYRGTAHASGKWSIPKNETALVGELGTELRVDKNGYYETIGDRGAEFVNLKKGDIVFNH